MHSKEIKDREDEAVAEVAWAVDWAEVVEVDDLVVNSSVAVLWAMPSRPRFVRMFMNLLTAHDSARPFFGSCH
jgi:hypothetical protein